MAALKPTVILYFADMVSKRVWQYDKDLDFPLW